jgi:hypothetical protein
MKRLPAVILLNLFALTTGCARYEYNIVSPENLRAHIGTNTDHVATLDPLTYRFRAVDNRLVIRIYNETQDSITLEGDRSTVVSPNGQSHPLRSQTIAPASFIKLIFPPIRPQFPPTGPTIGFGIGTRVDARGRGRAHGSDPPKYLATYSPDEALYWDWDGQTDVTATFAFRRADKPFQHQFIFHRQKM